MTILLVILMLVVLIVAHELGHFIAAKLSGVRVQEFGVGYPPTALSLGHIGETEYTLNWIPFGGFVRLFGDSGENERGPGSFVSAHRAKQAMILVAGICMNLIAGWMLFTVAYSLGIPRPLDTSADTPASVLPGAHLFIAGVVPGSPADSAGIRAGDELVAMVDKNDASPATLSPEGIRSFVETHGGQKLDVSYLRSNSTGAKATSTTGVIPANAVIPGAPGKAGVGVDLVLITSNPLPLTEASMAAFHTSYGAFIAVGENVWGIIKNAALGSLNLQGIVGPVGLVSVVGDASQAGLGQVLALAGFISINLAVINLLPIPMLDGGRIVVVAFEAILRRRAPKLVIHILNTIGVVAVLLLMVVVTYHDIVRLFT